jgi:hypothetical protein
MTPARHRERSHGAPGRQVLQRLVDVAVVIAALTPVVVLAGLALLFLMLPLLPDSWTDAWVGIHP